MEETVILFLNKNDVNFKLKNGVLFFKENPFSGTVNEFYEDKKIKSISAYHQGKRHGKYFGWYQNKQKWFERFYQDGIKKGVHKGWFKDGQKMFDYQLNKNGVYNGSVKDWYFNGQLEKHFNFVDGKEVGSQKMWTINGKIRSNFYTVNNERHGLIGLKKCASVVDHKTENRQ